MHSQSNIKLPTVEVAHFHTVIAWSHNVQECKNVTAFGGACQNQAKIAKTRANCWNVYFPIHLSHYCWQGYVDDAVERWWLGSAVFDYLLSWNIKYSYIHLLNSFIHSLYFLYIHIQVKYQGSGNCQSSCINNC